LDGSARYDVIDFACRPPANETIDVFYIKKIITTTTIMISKENSYGWKANISSGIRDISSI